MSSNWIGDILLLLCVFLVGMLFMVGTHGNNFKDDDYDSKFPD